jgi:hypothetical protein
MKMSSWVPCFFPFSFNEIHYFQTLSSLDKNQAFIFLRLFIFHYRCISNHFYLFFLTYDFFPNLGYNSVVIINDQHLLCYEYHHFSVVIPPFHFFDRTEDFLLRDSMELKSTVPLRSPGILRPRRCDTLFCQSTIINCD